MARAACSTTRCRSLSFRSRRRPILFPCFRHDRRRCRPDTTPFLACGLFQFPSLPGHPDDALGFFPGPYPSPIVGLELIPDMETGQGVFIPFPDVAVGTSPIVEGKSPPFDPDEPQGLGDGPAPFPFLDCGSYGGPLFLCPKWQSVASAPHGRERCESFFRRE
jgi:hypothetical protein